MIERPLTVTGPWPHGDPADVARKILSDPRFHTAPIRPHVKTWWELVGDALRGLWNRLTDPLGRMHASEALTNAIGIAVLVVVVLGLGYATFYFTRNMRPRHARGDDGDGAVGLGAEADARTLLARALEAAAAGRHHDAAALLWASALRALDERGRVRYDASRTPGEWRRAVRDPAFDALARDAVVALFGDRGADADLVARMRSSYERVVTA